MREITYHVIHPKKIHRAKDLYFFQPLLKKYRGLVGSLTNIHMYSLGTRTCNNIYIGLLITQRNYDVLYTYIYSTFLIT